MPIELLDRTCAPAPTNEAISEFEKSLGIQLPEAFIDVLKSANAAVPLRREFPAGDDWRLIDRFLGLVDVANPLRAYDIRLALEDLVERLLTAEELEVEAECRAKVLPVAVLFAGDHVCLDYRGDEEPSVRLWVHEESRVGAPVYVDVAPTFAAFLELLEEEYVREPTLLDGFKDVTYNGPDEDEVQRPTRAFLEEVLRRGEDYWEPGRWAGLTIKKAGETLDVGLFVGPAGVLVSYTAEDDYLCRASRIHGVPGVVAEMIGSFRVDVPRRFYLPVDEAFGVIEHFIAHGSPDDGEWVAVW